MTRMNRRKWLVSFIIATTAVIVGMSGHSPLRAQDTRVVLYLQHTGSDAVGRSLANELAVALARNPKYTVTTSLPDAALVVHVVTVETACETGGATAAAIGLVTNNRAQSLLDLRNVTVSATLTREMAERTLVNIDKAIAEWQSTR